LGGGGFVVVLCLLKGETIGAVLVAAEIGKAGGQVANMLPTLFGIGTIAEPVLVGHHEFDGGNAGQGIDDLGGVGFGCDVLRIFGELEGQVPGILELNPVLISAAAPLGEVLLGDAVALEILN